jgi:hypothetical protein
MRVEKLVAERTGRRCGEARMLQVVEPDGSKGRERTSGVGLSAAAISLVDLHPVEGDGREVVDQLLT